MKPLLKIVVCAAVLVAGLSAKADLFFYEPFPTSYTNGGTLVTLPNGSTLAGTRLNDQTAVWGIGQGGGGGSPTNTFGAALQHGTLAYSNGSCGLYLSTNTTSGNRTRGVLLTNTPINTGSVYMSFLLNVQVASTGNRLFSLFSSAITGSPGASTVAGVWVNATTNLMLSKGSSSTPGATSATSLTPGTHLIVMRYTYNSGSTTDDQMDLWIDPSSLGGGTIPSSDLVNTAGTDISTLSSFYIYHPSSGYVPAGLFVDEIRVGTTWAEVTPTGVCTPAGAGTGPTNQASVVGSTASFAVAPVGTLPNYQWQLSTDNGTSWNNVAANGNTANYTTPTLIGADNGSRFRCVITVPCDSSSATSAVATLTVADPTGKWFRSVASGNWNANATWELSTDGLTWVAAAPKIKLIPDHLAACDLPRRNDLDGRGNLSEETLTEFTTFFLTTCIDQVSFMENLMQPDQLRTRILLWAEEEIRLNKIPPKSGAILEAVLYRGEIPRAETPTIFAASERSASRFVSALIERGVLKSESTRAPLRLAFPAALAARWMPGLFPERTS